MDPNVDPELTPTPIETRPPSEKVADAMAPLTELAESVRRELRHQVEVRPYTTVLAAAAAGYILGGGVPTWVGRAAVNVGSRVLIARLVSALVEDR